jgi:prolyl oligopeptidase
MRRRPERRSPQRPRESAWLALTALAAALAAAAPARGATETTRDTTSSMPKPPATRVEEVVETIHGVRIVDPYRWLEDGSSPEVRSWVDGQNAYARALLDARPGRQALRARLADLLSIGSIDPPEVRAGLYFYTRRDGRQNQPILYVRQGLRGKDRALVDPNRLSEDGTATIDWWFPTEDGRFVAYGVSTSGDEKSTLRVIEVRTGRVLPDVIPHTRYCSLAWLPDDGGFYYTRYPAPGSVPPGRENYDRHVFLHRIGGDPAADPEVFGRGRKPEEMIDISISPDGRWLVATVAEGWARNDLYLRDLKSENGAFVPVAEGIDAIFSGKVIGGTLYLLTNWEAPRYRLYAVDVTRPQRDAWKVLIPESDAVLNQAEVVGNRIVTLSLRDASSRLALHALDGKPIKEIALPGIGSIERLSGRHDGTEAFFDYSSFTTPPAVYRLDVPAGAAAVWERVKTDLDLARYEVKQVFYPSKDGTKIPMFLVHRKGLVPDGASPTLLYGYGGFNVNMTPAFSRGMVAWYERGGIYAQVVLRGGGEYGEDWHRAGMLGRKQNVFDDFLAAAEWLIANHYTSAEHLAIRGGSNGGLLMGAALTQRPDLFKAVDCEVPLLDMLRYQNFQIARLWVPEYGSAELSDQFAWLYAYSPYQHVKPDTRYPAVYLATADSDSRVDPMHARKMAALLQASHASDRPVVLRTETRAGHGVGKPLSKQIDDLADAFTFLFWQLGLEPKAGA